MTRVLRMKRNAPWLRTGRNYRPTATTTPDLDTIRLQLALVTALAEPVRDDFHENQPRDPRTGKWIHVGGKPWEGFADSQAMHAMPDGSLSPERSALHQRIVAGTLTGIEPSASPVAMFLGGGPASGKSTLLGVHPAKGPIVAADDIKGELPEFRDMVEAGEAHKAAPFVHNESTAIADQVVAKAEAGHISFTLDGTGDSSYARMHAKTSAARAAGHRVDAVYVTVPTDVAVGREKLRAKETGRVVPETVTREKHASVSGVWRKSIENGDFDTAELWDNRGKVPVLIASKNDGGTLSVHWPEMYQEFLDKEHEYGPG
jgi:predicted ABC-type ATPase